MRTTVHLTSETQTELPKEFCSRNKIGKGSTLRAIEIAGGIFLTPQDGPTLAELERVIAEAGSHDHEQTPDEAALVERVIEECRASRRNGQ
jgi:hypothetical protein